MSRPPRINVSDLIYHVFARGNNRENIFFVTEDFQRFYHNLVRFRDSLNFTLYAYCLLPNHFHLLLRSGKVPLSKIMQVLMTAYTMYINKKHGRVGHVFQGRFKSIVVEKETYLLELLRYIHLNPVKAGLVDKADQYPWSSYIKYLTPGEEDFLVETKEIMSMFSEDSHRQKRLLIEFTNEGLGIDFNPQRDQARGILGSSKFAQSITRRLRGIRQ